MKFTLRFTAEAKQNLEDLENNRAEDKRCRIMKRTLGYLETNPKHPSLNTHKYDSLRGPNGEEVFEAYAQNNTPGAYRVFWYYGPGEKIISIVAIVPHPK